jgi:predicted DNA-binding transcriptional regulator AlpA
MKNNTTALPNVGFLRVPKITNLLSISKSCWWKGIKDGRFPKGKKLSPQVTVWDVKDIRALIDKINNGGFENAK